MTLEDIARQMKQQETDENEMNEEKQERLKALHAPSQSDIAAFNKLCSMSQAEDIDGIILAYNTSLTNVARLNEKKDLEINRLDAAERMKDSLVEDLELLQLTGRGVINDKKTYQQQEAINTKLDKADAKLRHKRVKYLRVKKTLIDLSQGLVTMLAKARAQDKNLAIQAENALGSVLKQPPMQAGQFDFGASFQLAEDLETQDIQTLFKHFEEMISMIHKNVEAGRDPGDNPTGFRGAALAATAMRELSTGSLGRIG